MTYQDAILRLGPGTRRSRLSTGGSDPHTVVWGDMAVSGMYWKHGARLARHEFVLLGVVMKR